jgi:hypothetical protein
MSASPPPIIYTHPVFPNMTYAPETLLCTGICLQKTRGAFVETNWNYVTSTQVKKVKMKK